ncbi:MAG: hypothetical protein ABI890_17660 [Lapillicoccus sp.]
MSARLKRRSGPHHPRVSRSRSRDLWCWDCPCGASGPAGSTPTHRGALISAIVHVDSQPRAR